MAQQRFRLEVVTPQRLLVSDEVDEITAPGIEGEFGVLPGHTPFLTALGVGELMYRIGGEEHFLALRHGFAEVQHEKVTVLAEEAEFPSEIDLSRAEAEKAEAEAELQRLSHESREYAEAQAKLERAVNRIQVASRHLR
ncbi:MAG: F0F1 ATP synthase subunit epsilon [Deltaproteobacteria bacterium]|nr:F0F1 ATP synthase subunit epsilon [Deltaproteobacteria bacterium]